MTDWDSEAARDVLNHGTTISQFRLALGATLARLAEVEAERDAALHTAETFCDSGRRALAQMNAMRRVVEAAEALAAAAEQSTAPRTPLFAAFLAAVDAYRAGQNSPASPSESTLGDEQAEPAVASTNTTQAQRGVQGLLRRLTADEVVEPARRLETQPDLLDADPPGLDAAIEAARRVAQRGAYVSPRWVDEAVRAAAPALRAGALREAADEIGVKWDTTVSIADWLRERADREVAK